MKKIITILTGIALIFSILVIAPAVQAEEITDFVDYETQAREVQTFNILNIQSAETLNVLCNLTEPLLTNDNYGHLVPNIAYEWGTEDNGKTWTFKLHDNVVWVDVNGEEKAKCVAEDWLWGLEWVLNFHKNNAVNTSMPIQLIAGAGDYYEYTRGLEEAEGKALDLDKFKEMVGVEAPDDYTLIYHCSDEYPYFDTLFTYACMYPVSGKLLEEIGVEGFLSLNNETMWYNGPYMMTTYVMNNEKIYTKNPLYFNEDAKRFNTVTVKMVESVDNAFQLYQTGEIDRVTLSESNLQTIYRSDSNEFHDYLVEARPDKWSYQMHFCFNKFNKDGKPDENWNTAIRNEDFRQAIRYGLQLEDYLSRTNAINPLSCVNLAYTKPGVAFTSDGTDYVDLVLEKLGYEPYGTVYDTYPRYEPEKFEEYKAKAVEALQAEGVEFPVQLDFYIKAGNQAAADTALVLKTVFEDCLGKDFIQLNIGEYVSSLTKEVRDPQLGSMYINGWGADFGDPINFLSQEIYGNDNAYYAQEFSHINDLPEDHPLVADYQEFTELVNKASAINDDKDARYDAFADAEVYMLNKAFVIPIYHRIQWMLTTVNPYSQIFCPYGNQNYRYINWETNRMGYTTEEVEQFKADYEANAKD